MNNPNKKLNKNLRLQIYPTNLKHNQKNHKGKMKKILIAGDVNGNFDPILKRLKKFDFAP